MSKCKYCGIECEYIDNANVKCDYKKIFESSPSWRDVREELLSRIKTLPGCNDCHGVISRYEAIKIIIEALPAPPGTDKG